MTPEMKPIEEAIAPKGVPISARRCEVSGCERTNALNDGLVILTWGHELCTEHWLEYTRETYSTQMETARLERWLAKRAEATRG